MGKQREKQGNLKKTGWGFQKHWGRKGIRAEQIRGSDREGQFDLRGDDWSLKQKEKTKQNTEKNHGRISDDGKKYMKERERKDRVKVTLEKSVVKRDITSGSELSNQEQPSLRRPVFFHIKQKNNRKSKRKRFFSCFGLWGIFSRLCVKVCLWVKLIRRRVWSLNKNNLRFGDPTKAEELHRDSHQKKSTNDVRCLEVEFSPGIIYLFRSRRTDQYEDWSSVPRLLVWRCCLSSIFIFIQLFVFLTPSIFMFSTSSPFTPVMGHNRVVYTSIRYRFFFLQILFNIIFCVICFSLWFFFLNTWQILTIFTLICIFHMTY